MSPTIRDTDPYKPFTVRIETAPDAGRYCLDAYNIVVHGKANYRHWLKSVRLYPGREPRFSARLPREPRVRVSTNEGPALAGRTVDRRGDGLRSVTSTDLGGGESELVRIVDDFFGQLKASLRVAFEHYDSRFRCDTCGGSLPNFLCNHGRLRDTYNRLLKDCRQADKRNPGRYDEDSANAYRSAKPD